MNSNPNKDKDMCKCGNRSDQAIQDNYHWYRKCPHYSSPEASQESECEECLKLPNGELCVEHDDLDDMDFSDSPEYIKKGLREAISDGRLASYAPPTEKEEWENELYVILDAVFLHGKETPEYSFQGQLPRGQITITGGVKRISDLLRSEREKAYKKGELSCTVFKQEFLDQIRENARHTVLDEAIESIKLQMKTHPIGSLHDENQPNSEKIWNKALDKALSILASLRGE